MVQVQLRRLSAILRVIPLFAGLSACSQRLSENTADSICGGSLPVPEVEGLTWLAGAPTQANVVCEVREQKAKVLLSLDPDSRDPVLFREAQTALHILVERFSGRQARPSRVTWFSAAGQKLGQRGDWLQNVYAIVPFSNAEAIVTGFDASSLQRVSLKSDQFAAPLGEPQIVRESSDSRPIHSLVRNAKVAVIDNGYDLKRFQATVAKLTVSDFASTQPTGKPLAIEDSRTGRQCFNAFQALAVSPFEVVLSCNPQYFGPNNGQTVAVFKVSLSVDGNVDVRELLAFDGVEIQRIDLWGLDDQGAQLFVGLKTTTAENYEGRVARAGWLNLSTAGWIPESRFLGPLFRRPEKNLSIVACSAASERCSPGQFVSVGGGLPWSDNAPSQVLPITPQLPFLSFAQELRSQ